MSTVYKYNKSNLSYSELHAELASVIPGNTLIGISTCKDDSNYTILVEWDNELSGADKITQDGIIINHQIDTLDILKRQLMDKIDKLAIKRFQSILTFTYNTIQFSISTTAQEKIQKYFDNRDIINYPKRFKSKNNLQQITINNSTEMAAFYNAMAAAFIDEMDLIQDTKISITDANNSQDAIDAANLYLEG